MARPWLLVSPLLLILGCGEGALAPLPLAPTAPSDGGARADSTRWEGALGSWDLHLTREPLAATLTAHEYRAARSTADVYGLELGAFLRPESLRIRGLSANATTIDLAWEFRHPFDAPADLAAPPSATNRLDLGFAGRLLLLADVPSAPGHRYFTEVIANTDLLANADAYLRPHGLLADPGTLANTFPAVRLVDESLDPRVRSGSDLPISNGGDYRGNHDPSVGWQRAGLGPANDGWTGYGVLHQGQATRGTLQLRVAALAAGSATLRLAVLARYADPRGGTSGPARRANRLPAEPPDVTRFVYREPHGALDCEALTFLGESGGFAPNLTSASTLSFALIDLDAPAAESSASDLASESDPRKVAQGESGAPALAVCIPGVLGDHTTSVDLDLAPTGTGEPATPLLYSESLTKPDGSGQIEGTYVGLLRATDPEASLDPGWWHPLNPALGPAIPPPDGAVYQAFRVTMADPTPDPPSWVATWGGSGSTVLALATVVDPATGTSFTTGQFNGTVDFDPGSGVQNRSTPGSASPFCLALDASGAFLWVATVATSNGAAPAVARAPDGSLRVCGLFAGMADFDPGPGTAMRTSAGANDIFCLALEADGDFRWVATMGGLAEDQARGCDVRPDGATLLTGPFRGMADFDPSAGGTVNRSSNGLDDAYCLALDASGLYQWVATWGGAATDYGYGVGGDSANNVRICGRWQGTVDFDPGAGTQSRSAQGTTDSYVLGLSASGAYQWVAPYGGSGATVRAHALDLTASGGVRIEAPFSGTVDFDPGGAVQSRGSVGGVLDDASALALTSAGSYEWVAVWGGAGNDGTLGIVVDALDRVYVTGTFDALTDLDPGPGSDPRTRQPAESMASASRSMPWAAIAGARPGAGQARTSRTAPGWMPSAPCAAPVGSLGPPISTPVPAASRMRAWGPAMGSCCACGLMGPGRTPSITAPLQGVGKKTRVYSVRPNGPPCQENATRMSTTAPNAPAFEPPALEVKLDFTPEALAKIRYFEAKQEDPARTTFRIYVEAGGCSGLQYGFVFDQLRDGDHVFENDGLTVVVDPTSIMYMNGATVHYVEDFTGAGFSVKNPQSTGSCGCGHSFFTN